MAITKCRLRIFKEHIYWWNKHRVLAHIFFSLRKELYLEWGQCRAFIDFLTPSSAQLTLNIIERNIYWTFIMYFTRFFFQWLWCWIKCYPFRAHSKFSQTKWNSFAIGNSNVPPGSRQVTMLRDGLQSSERWDHQDTDSLRVSIYKDMSIWWPFYLCLWSFYGSTDS